MHEKPGALDVALRALTARARSEKEIVEKLRQRGFDEHEIAKAMAKLTEYALVDDGAFAGQWARHRAGRGLGPWRIARELREKGVDREAADVALEALSEDTLLASATELAAKHLRRGDDNAKRRAMDALVRRGFSFAMARTAIDAAKEAIEEEEREESEP